MKINKPHCSKLDRIFACPGSILPGGAPREAGGPEAIAGRAKHEALSYIPRGLASPVDEIAAKYGVDRDELILAVRLGRRAWDDDGAYFPDPEVERQVESPVCLGTSDLVQVMISEGTVAALRVWDWKTGWGDDEHPRQLQGYADGLVEEFGWPSNDVVSAWEVWTTHQKKRVVNLGREDLEAFRSELASIVKTAEETPDRLEYRAGPHCCWCQHRSDCRTRGDWLRGAVTAIMEVDPVQGITVDDIGRAYLRFVEVQRACDRFVEIVKAALEEGSIPLPDGRRVEYVESEREKIGANTAIAALLDSGIISAGDDCDVILGDLTKAAIDRWARANSTDGGKAALMRKIYKELRGAGAIRTVPHRQRGVVDGD